MAYLVERFCRCGRKCHTQDEIDMLHCDACLEDRVSQALVGKDQDRVDHGR